MVGDADMRSSGRRSSSSAFLFLPLDAAAGVDTVEVSSASHGTNRGEVLEEKYELWAKMCGMGGGGVQIIAAEEEAAGRRLDTKGREEGVAGGEEEEGGGKRESGLERAEKKSLPGAAAALETSRSWRRWGDGRAPPTAARPGGGLLTRLA
jgi:hypothetical protein